MKKVPRNLNAKETGTAAPKVELTGNNRTPLYYQIFLILRSKIADGEYQEGAFLPGEWELAQNFNVSRITAIRALNELAACGLVSRERGRGTRVHFVGRGTVVRGPTEGANSYAVRWTRTDGTVESFVAQSGAKAHSKAAIVEFAYLPATQDIAAHLRIAPGDEVQYATRVWRFEGKPFNHVTTYIPAAIGRCWNKSDFVGSTLAALLERAGTPIRRVEEQVTAALADALLSERLEVAVGSPLVKIVRKAFGGGDRVVEYALGFYPPDRFHYFVTLTPRMPGGTHDRKEETLC